MKPSPGSYFTKPTFVKQWIRKGRLLIYDVTQESLELRPDDKTISTKSCCRAPIEAIFTWFYPGGQFLTTPLFWQLREHLS